MKYGKIILVFILFLALLLIIANGTVAGEGVRQGLSLSYRVVLPALFPAMIVCGMIGELAEYVPLPPAWTLWVTSHLCGFPLGIKTVAQSYRRGLLSKRQALALSSCCSNASPAFLILYVGKGVLGSSITGLWLFCAQLIISFLIALFSGALKPTITSLSQDRPLLTIIAESLSTAATGALTLTCYITAFSILASMMRSFPLFPYCYGFLELTGGIRGGAVLAAAMVGFSGCSVLLQNASYLTAENLSPLPMVLGKQMYALFLPLSIFLLENLTN